MRMSYALEWIPAGLVAVVALLCVPPVAMAAVVVVLLAVLLALAALVGAILATPYLLVRSFRRRHPRDVRNSL
jgi:hypothetical protein